MNEIDELVESFYDSEAKLGSVVTLRSYHYETSVTGEVTGIKRLHGLRVSHPDIDYDYVLFQGYAIRVAGIKQWFPIASSDEETSGKWQIEVSLTDQAAKKLKTAFRKE
jgi:hypothetical protein